ncbi:MAG: CAP domain-containing protein, partial [Actinomycetota bacterium]
APIFQGLRSEADTSPMVTVAALRPMARRATTLVAVAACLVALAPASADAARPVEEQFATLVNEVRETSGKDSMSLSDRLSRTARRHSRRMARAGKLFHSNLNRLLSRRSGGVGENVGYGDSLPELLKAFMHSPPHEDNLLGGWRRTGVGIVKAGGRYWLTQIFRS